MQGVRPVQAAGRHVPLSQTLCCSANASIAPAPLFCSSRGVAVIPGHGVEARAAGPVAASSSAAPAAEPSLARSPLHFIVLQNTSSALPHYAPPRFHLEIFFRVKYIISV